MTSLIRHVMPSMETIFDNSSLTELLNSLSLGNYLPGEVAHRIDASTSTVPATQLDVEIQSRVKYLETNYRSRLVTMIYHETFFPGESNETIAFIGTLRRYTDVALEKWFNNLYSEYYNTPQILRGLLYIILYFNDIFDATLATVAVAAISNESCEIQELGVRMLESKCCKKHLESLKGLKKQEPWLQDYIDQVKSDFEKQLCRY